MCEPLEIKSAHRSVDIGHLFKVRFYRLGQWRWFRVDADSLPTPLLELAVHGRNDGAMHPSFEPVIEQRAAIDCQKPSLGIIQQLLELQVGNLVSMLMRKTDEEIGNDTSACFCHIVQSTRLFSVYTGALSAQIPRFCGGPLLKPI